MSNPDFELISVWPSDLSWVCVLLFDINLHRDVQSKISHFVKAQFQFVGIMFSPRTMPKLI